MPTTARCALALLTVVALLALHPGAGAAPKAKPKGKAATKPAATQPAEPAGVPAGPAEKVDGLFGLAGQVGLPAYLRCDQGTMGDLKGVRGGELRTIDSDFFRKDFTLDVVFRFDGAGDRRRGFVGIGENGRDGAAVVNSVLVELTDPNARASGRPGDRAGGAAWVNQPGQRERTLLGRYGDHAGPHLLRMSKRGGAVTFALAAKFDGATFQPDFTKTVPDLAAAAPGLNRLNSHLFFGGSVTFTAVRLTVDGKTVDPGPPADAGDAARADPAGEAAGLAWIRPGLPLPSYWAPNPHAVVGPDGIDLRRTTLTTAAGDFVTKDFTLDVVFRLRPDDNGALLVGIGANRRDSGNWVHDSLVTRVHGAGNHWAAGQAATTFHSFAGMREYGRVPAGRTGPNLLRMRKRGDTLMFALCVDYAGKFEPDFVTVAPLLKYQAPYLTDRNSQLFVGESATVERVRLVVDGGPAGAAPPAVAAGPDPAAAAAATRPAVAPALVRLGGTNPLPPFLTASLGMTSEPDGLRGGTLRTAATDLVDHDFVFDLLVRFDDEAHHVFVGLGAGTPARIDIDGSVYAEVGGPRQDGTSLLKASGVYELPFGNVGKQPGVHYVRMEKRANTLTWSVHPQYKEGEPFRPTLVRGIPDLAAVGRKFLDRTNGGVFVMVSGTWTAAGLTVDGRPVGDPAAGAAAVATTRPAAPTAPPNPGPAAAAAAPGLVRLGGTNAMPAFLTCTADTAADPDGLRGGVLRSVPDDMVSKDFVFDLVLKFADDDIFAYVGIGPATPARQRIESSVYADVGGPRQSGTSFLRVRNDAELPIGNVGATPGVHYVRLAKRKNVLTCSIHPQYKLGEPFRPTIVRGLPDLAGASRAFLDRTNSGLFVMGQATVMAVGLSVDGAPAGGTAVAATGADGPAVARPAATTGPAAAAAPLFRLGGQAGLPRYLRASSSAYATAEGLRGGDVGTVAEDLAAHDFVFDLLFKPDPAEGEFRAGIGAGTADDRGRIANSVCARVTNPSRDPAATVTIGHDASLPIGKAPGAGPHLLRIEKRGRSLTVAVALDHKGAFAPTLVRTLPDLAGAAPFLAAGKGGLFVGGSGTLMAVGLSVDGRPVDPGPPADAGVPDLAGPEHLFKLAGATRLPDFFEPNRDVAMTPAGVELKGKALRTRLATYATANFTFDVAFRFAAGERASMSIGLGEGVFGEEASLPNTVYARPRFPGTGNNVTFGTGAQGWYGEAEWAKLGRPGATHLLRIRKRNDVLTMAIDVDFDGTFKPAATRTFPSLRAVAPYLTARNGVLFVQGDGGVVEQVRLVVEGAATETGDLAMTVPPLAAEGIPLRAQVGKRAEGRRFAAVGAAAGLAVSPDGLMTWTPTRDQIGVRAFRIAVTERGATAEQAVEVEVVAREDAAAAGGDLSKVAGLYKLPLESQEHQLARGLGGTSLLLLEGRQLRRLGPDGIAVLQTLELPRQYRWVGERADYFVALSDADKCLDLVDKRSLKVTRSVQMPYTRRHDLALHPHRPACYVAVDRGVGNGLVPMIVVVDEPTGDVREPTCPGTWLAASPDGRWLYAGYKDVYRRGDRLLINPDRIDVVPQYGSIDVLIAYDVSDPLPVADRAVTNAGGNGQGLVMSPDGRRVSYLSFVGYPKFTGNIPAWDVSDLGKRPVSYAAKDRKADCRRVAFHPSLPIAAAPADGGAACFDRETGEAQPDRLNLRGVPADTKVLDLAFSPDGRFLLLDCDAKGRRFLRQVPLNLSPAEAARAKEPPAVVPPAVPRRAPPPPPAAGGPQKV